MQEMFDSAKELVYIFLLIPTFLNETKMALFHYYHFVIMFIVNEY